MRLYQLFNIDIPHQVLAPFILIGSNGDNLFSNNGLHSLGSSDLLVAGVNPDLSVDGDLPGICLPVSGVV